MPDMPCSIRSTLENECLLSGQEFDRLKNKLRVQIAFLSQSEYEAMSAQVIAASLREQITQTALREHMREHGC